MVQIEAYNISFKRTYTTTFRGRELKLVRLGDETRIQICVGDGGGGTCFFEEKKNL